MSSRIFAIFNEADKMADLLNNAIGREIGANNKGCSNRRFAELVLEEYKNNGLWCVTGNAKDGYSVQKSKLSQSQYNTALQVIMTKGNNGLTE